MCCHCQYDINVIHGHVFALLYEFFKDKCQLFPFQDVKECVFHEINFKEIKV